MSESYSECPYCGHMAPSYAKVCAGCGAEAYYKTTERTILGKIGLLIFVIIVTPLPIGAVYFLFTAIPYFSSYQIPYSEDTIAIVSGAIGAIPGVMILRSGWKTATYKYWRR